MKLTLIIFSFLFSISINAQNYWGPRADLPSLSRYSAVGFSIDSLGYLCCGKTGANLGDDLWQYTPSNNSWKLLASVPGGGLGST